MKFSRCKPNSLRTTPTMSGFRKLETSSIEAEKRGITAPTLMEKSVQHKSQTISKTRRTSSRRKLKTQTGRTTSKYRRSTTSQRRWKNSWTSTSHR